MKRPILKICMTVVALLIGVGIIYINDYSPADDAARAALTSTAEVEVTFEDQCIRFDGPGDDHVLIFYPGGKVEHTAYAPLMKEIAARGVDCCLVEMPLRFAFLGIDRAIDVIERYDYAHRYIGGHSLGGAMAAHCASAHPDAFDGIVLLAAYATKPIKSDMWALTLYGSEDGVVDPGAYDKYRDNLPADRVERSIEGGNHAGFGAYGIQKGDGVSVIEPEEQRRLTAEAILEMIETH